MSYRLAPGETLASGLRRALGEELDAAATGLADVASPQVDETVHEVRKSLKRSRTVVRLLRDVLGDDPYRSANDRLRDAGLALSGTRDAAVLVETLEGVLAGPELDAAPFAGLRERLARELADAQRLALTDAGPRAEALELIAAARADTAGWDLAAVSEQRVLRGVRRVYRRGRQRMRDAAAGSTDEALHEWRKRVKDLGYTLQLAEPAWPEVIEPVAGEARRLWGLLGDSHDLHLLSVAVEERAATLQTPADHETLQDVIAARRAELRRCAFALGGRLYADRPKAFTRRLREHLGMLRAA